MTLKGSHHRRWYKTGSKWKISKGDKGNQEEGVSFFMNSSLVVSGLLLGPRKIGQQGNLAGPSLTLFHGSLLNKLLGKIRRIQALLPDWKKTAKGGGGLERLILMLSPTPKLSAPKEPSVQRN